jgi:hypothetical protein
MCPKDMEQVETASAWDEGSSVGGNDLLEVGRALLVWRGHHVWHYKTGLVDQWLGG